MNNVWQRLLKHSSDLLPNFNDYLLLEFRKNKLAHIKQYMEDLFIASIANVQMFDDKLKYLGCRELNPDERIEYMRTNTIINKQVCIQESSFTIVRYDFEFEGEIYPVFLHLPYLQQYAVVSKDTKFYPIFPIIERGSIQRTSQALTVSPLRGLLRFYRNETANFSTEGENGRFYSETLITAQIHQRKTPSVGRGGSDPAKRLPIILYPLARFQFEQVLADYGFAEDEFKLSNQSAAPEGYAVIKIKDNYFLWVKNESLEDMHKRRFIAGYLEILHFRPNYEMRDLVAKDGRYYKTVLGQYTYPTSSNAGTMHDNAIKHLETTDTFLDTPTLQQLAAIGIPVNDIYGLLHAIFFNIDNWLVGYDPTNMYNKKIGSLEKLLSKIVTKLNNRLFDIINNKKEGLKKTTISRFTKSVSQSEESITSSEVFRANPSICNDNWLIAIGAQRYRSAQTTETNATKKKKVSHKMSMLALKAHPSQLVVESILHLPSSSPVVSGSINPFVQIDENGNFIPPPWASELDHIFD